MLVIESCASLCRSSSKLGVKAVAARVRWGGRGSSYTVGS